MLVNPNLMDNERYKRNIENRKKGDRYKPYDEDVDEWGNVSGFGCYKGEPI